MRNILLLCIMVVFLTSCNKDIGESFEVVIEVDNPRPSIGEEVVFHVFLKNITDQHFSIRNTGRLVFLEIIPPHGESFYFPDVKPLLGTEHTLQPEELYTFMENKLTYTFETEGQYKVYGISIFDILSENEIKEEVRVKMKNPIIINVTE
jgi:hypothetical protein